MKYAVVIASLLVLTSACADNLYAEEELSSRCEQLFTQQQFEAAMIACDKAAREGSAKAKAYMRLASHHAANVKKHSDTAKNN